MIKSWRGQRHNTDFLDQRKDLISQRLEEGISQAKIAREIGVSHSMLNYYVRENFKIGRPCPTKRHSDEVRIPKAVT